MLRGTLEYQGGQVGAHKFVEHLESYLSFLNNPLSSMRLGRRCNAEIGKNARNREILTDGLTIKPTLPSDSQSRVRMTLLLFFFAVLPISFMYKLQCKNNREGNLSWSAF